jgi:hypothetical protein
VDLRVESPFSRYHLGNESVFKFGNFLVPGSVLYGEDVTLFPCHLSR